MMIQLTQSLKIIYILLKSITISCVNYLMKIDTIHVYDRAIRDCEALWCSGSALAFGSIGHGFESEHRLFSHLSASAFSKLRSLAKCSLDDSVRRLL